MRGESLQTCGLTGKDDAARKNGYHQSVKETRQTGAISHTKCRSETKTFCVFDLPRLNECIL